MKTNVKKSEFSDLIFCWYNNKWLKGLIYCHTDDFFGWTKHFAESVINKLKEKFLTRLEKIADFKYIYQNLVQKNDCVYLD